MQLDLLIIFIPLILGYLFKLKSERWMARINVATTNIIYLILFFMGISLSEIDNFTANIQTIIGVTLVFTLVVGTANLLVLPIIDRLLPVSVEIQKNKISRLAMAMDSLKLIVVVGLGLILGLLLPFSFSYVDKINEAILLALLFLIGIQLRNSGLTLKQIILNKHGLIISCCVIISSWLGGLVAAFWLDLPILQSLAMASGFGWYSLAGILVGDAYGAVYGGASFMIELSRELIALLLIPVLIRRYSCTAIGYAGATAMDFTLPIIQQTGGIRCVPIAIVSGFILSLMMPILILFFVSLS